MDSQENDSTPSENSLSANEPSAPESSPTDAVDNIAPQDHPADALSRTPDELEEEQASQNTNDNPTTEPSPQKKPSRLKSFFRRINIYLMIFVLLVAVAGIVTVVYYLNSQKEPVLPAVASQELTEEALRQLANNDASVGSSSQTLTIQGNAVIDGQTLMRGNLNIAGNFQSGGSIQGPTLTISGSTNLGDTQINTLQVAGNTAIQGDSTLRNLNVAGTSSFSGAMTASQITVSQLILSGNASLQVPNHLSFTGPSPSRTINTSALGGGGSASVNGSDTSGTININTGNSPAAGCLVRINFNQRFSNQPRVIISPVGAAASRTDYYVDRDQAGFSVCTSSPAPANQAFAFDYFAMN